MYTIRSPEMVWTGEGKDDGSEIKCQELRNCDARKLTLSDDPHLELGQNLLFEVDDLVLICVYYLQRRVNNIKAGAENDQSTEQAEYRVSRVTVRQKRRGAVRAFLEC